MDNTGSSAPLITNIKELKAILGNHFVVLFGSALSGVMEPRLPMIGDVTRTFLNQTAQRLSFGTYREKVIGAYARDISDPAGYHNALLRQTKFESFIFELQKSVGKDRVDDLFLQLFTCRGNQYNNNHSALAFLLQKRNCLMALTTNFDNQLELCLPGLKTYIYPNRPDQIPSPRNRPVLIKLHGDAPSKTYIATSPQLSQAKSLETYAFIEELLRDQVVLVLGYSGTGDVDIAPHLGKFEKCIIWGNLSPEIHNTQSSNQINLLCNLSLAKPGMKKDGIKNILLELAGSYGWKPPSRKLTGDTSWQETIINWTNSIPLESLGEFIKSFMSWRTSWPHVHMAHLGVMEKQSFKNRYDYALSAVQVAAYNSSENLLKSLIWTEPENLTIYTSVVELLGFTYWRKARYNETLSTFLALLKIFELLQTSWKANPDADARRIIAGAARAYLETLIEMVNSRRSLRQRTDIVHNSKAENVINILEKYKFDSDYYLNQIAIKETQHWLGTPAIISEVMEFFEECVAMQAWEAAAITAQYLLTLSLSEGKKAVNAILPHLRKRGSHKLIFKVKTRLAYEQANRIIPIQVLNLKVFRWAVLLGIELVLRIKCYTWNLDTQFHRIRVETGFLSRGYIARRK